MVATSGCNNLRMQFVKRALLRNKISGLYWVLGVNKIVYDATLDSMVIVLAHLRFVNLTTYGSIGTALY
uniref:Uncharacterized protein n=1 Tax=Tetranychus urticae TaxID=32264 RepID=T1JZL7_TETUR